MKRMISILLLLAIIIAVIHHSVPVLALDSMQDTEAITSEYVYPITPESDDWHSYTVLEKVLMLQIPKSELATMSNEELVAALASYPYLVDIYLYGNSVQEGVEVVRTYCSALNELLKRDPDLSTINDYLSNTANYSTSVANDQENDYREFRSRALADIFLSIESNSTQLLSSRAGYKTSHVLTPNGTQVEVFILIEQHTSDQHRTEDLRIIQSVYDAELVEVGSCLYNCHYFAWHMGGDTNSTVYKWMDNPSAYMTDGSYSITYTGNINAPHSATNIRNGDIIFYGSTSNLLTAHSAICVEASITGNAIRYIHCISKWGQLGVFRHDLSSVPVGYDTSTVSAWRLA